MKKNTIKEIKDWWNTNSYSYGINSNEKYLDVGVPDGSLESVIAEYERKYRKHLIESVDDKNRPGEYSFLTIL